VKRIAVLQERPGAAPFTPLEGCGFAANWRKTRTLENRKGAAPQCPRSLSQIDRGSQEKWLRCVIQQKSIVETGLSEA
jgi:hypothetical protein